MLFLIIGQWTVGMLRGNFVQQKKQVKKTVAIIGSTEKSGAAIANKFAVGNNRLLLIANEVNQLSQIARKIKRNNLNAEVEMADCAKEGCWQADIIVLAISFHELKKVIEKISEVATQKIVLFISNEYDESNATELQHLLPHSRIVTALFDSFSGETFIESNDEEASETISKMINTAVISR